MGVPFGAHHEQDQKHHLQHRDRLWRGHRLTAPPRGYHWVQVGPDHVLVAITTGIIASLILSQ